jgi:hypothetical protein
MPLASVPAKRSLHPSIGSGLNQFTALPLIALCGIGTAPCGDRPEPRVRVAWSIGIKLITQTWPASAAYTFVPPITPLPFATLNPVGFPAPIVVLLAVISTLIGLLVKGAIAAFYLRHAALPMTGSEAQLRA